VNVGSGLLPRDYRRKLCLGNGSPSDRQHNFTRAVSLVEEFDWISLKTKAHGTIRAVVDNESHGATEGWQTTAPSREPLAEALQGLRHKGDGSCRQVEVDAQKYVQARAARDAWCACQLGSRAME
jgi:hypothetical protein